MERCARRIGALAMSLASAAVAAQPAELCRDPGADTPIPDVRLVQAGRGFDDPVFVTGDRQGGLLVVEQDGVVRRLDSERGRPGEVFLDLRDRVVSGGERGLLGLAFHPDYPDDGRLFVNYTTPEGGLTTRISELRASPGEGADPGSERVVLAFAQPYTNHNGGMVLFGPDDGYLYIGTGDGGAANDPQNAGQRLDTLLGKMLRIDVDRGEPYGIPPDNPFVERAGARPEIYAYGLRNPWRFSIDPPTGRLYAGDVGQNAREEIDVVERGGNYGWRIMEGTLCTPGVSRDCDQTGLTLPIAEYTHDQGYSVTGGYVYRGTGFPALCGVYFYGDYGSGRLWGLRYDGETVTRQRLITDTGARIASFGRDDAGELYLVDYRGLIFRLTVP